MFELLLTHPEVDVPEAEFRRLLGFPKHYQFEGRSRELASWAREWFALNGRPWIYAREVAGPVLTEAGLSPGGVQIPSQSLHADWSAAGVQRAIVLAVCAGPECEARASQSWKEEKPDEYFFMEIFGSAVVEHLVSQANGHICARADREGFAALPHYSPGYTGWDVTDQHKLWQLLRAAGPTELPGHLEVMESGMLRPKKAQLALIGLTPDRELASRMGRHTPCSSCALRGCSFRRSPQESAAPVQDPASMSPTVPSAAVPPSQPAPAPAPTYSTPVRALEKWGRERLSLKKLADGSISALFRYEGSTCMNAGHPVVFNYQVKLSPLEDGYRITALECAPAPGDTGHQQQCAFLADPAGLLHCIACEKPLLGCPLADVLSWRRQADASACYCEPVRRAHKWAQVYEVIHLALTGPSQTAKVAPSA